MNAATLRRSALRTAGASRPARHCHRWQTARPVVRATTEEQQRASRTEQEDGKPRRSQELRQMEDELRDPKNFLEYFLPRPIRLLLFRFSAASATLATLLTISRVTQEPSATLFSNTALLQDLLVNLSAALVFAGLAVWDEKAGEQRIEQRKALREAQIRVGDRELFVNDQGEKMSRLKPVDDDWILRRLERWGRKDQMPFLGPKKGVILQGLVREKAPRLAVEVGTMAGYSALTIAKALPPSGKLISIEKDLQWVLAAKRFMWQASLGEKADRAGERVDVQWGDALSVLPRLASDPAVRGRVELLLLDGVPKEYLAYLQAAEPLLAPGALVVADNAGVFKDGGLKPYLEYVRSSPQYDSSFLESTFEWRDDVPDGMEVSIFKGAGSA